MDDIKNDIKEIHKSIVNIDITLAKQEVSLSEHMRRSEANEKAVKLLEQKLEPVTQHINKVDGAIKMVVIISILIGIIAGLFEIFK